MTVHAKPCGFRTPLGNRFAIATFPPPRRLLDSFNTKPKKGAFLSHTLRLPSGSFFNWKRLESR
jgi:hypothetical protein